MALPRAVTRGVIGGLILAAVSCLAVYLNSKNVEPFYTLASLVASSPVLLLLPSDFPDFFGWSVIFIYWVLAGAVIGWLVGQPRRPMRILGIVLILGVAVAHCITWQIILAKLGEAIASGLADMFQYFLVSGIQNLTRI